MYTLFGRISVFSETWFKTSKNKIPAQEATSQDTKMTEYAERSIP